MSESHESCKAEEAAGKVEEVTPKYGPSFVQRARRAYRIKQILDGTQTGRYPCKKPNRSSKGGSQEARQP